MKNNGIGANKRYFMGGLLLCLQCFFEGVILHSFLICVIKVGACCKFNVLGQVVYKHPVLLIMRCWENISQYSLQYTQATSELELEND